MNGHPVEGAAPVPISGQDLLERLMDRGWDFYCGVPCSLLDGLYRALDARPDVVHLRSVREDEAVGQAAGAWLAGRRPVVLMQNSGLGNALNAIVSLSQIYALPFLLVVSWRGHAGRDAPEHLVMGEAMTRILDDVHLPWRELDGANLERQLDAVARDAAAGRPTALIVRKGTVT